MDLGPHTTFIVLCYGITAAVIGGLVAWLWRDGVRLKSQLDALDRAVRDKGEAGHG